MSVKRLPLPDLSSLSTFLDEADLNLRITSREYCWHVQLTPVSLRRFKEYEFYAKDLLTAVKGAYDSYLADVGCDE